MEKNNKKKTIKLAAVLYLSILLIAAVATLSWFIFNNKASIKTDEEDIIITSGSANLEIAVEGTDSWGKEITLEAPEKTYIDVTSDGNTFLYPTYLIIDENSKDVPDLSQPDSFVDVTNDVNDKGETNYYMTLKIKFRTSEKMDIYLSNESYIDPLESVNGGSYSRESLFGNISCDGIAGAARVAFLEADASGRPVLKNVWIPNDSFELSYNNEGVASFSTNGVPESSLGYKYLYKEGNAIKTYNYTSDDIFSGNVTVDKNDLAYAEDDMTPMVGNAAPLLSFEKSNTMQEKTLIVRIWFEGTDRESDIALNGGALKYKFDFLGIDKQDAGSDAQVKINGVKTADYQVGESVYLRFADGSPCYDEIYYSEDGITWQNYGNGKVFTRGNSAYSVFIRSKETPTEQSGEVREITIPAK